METNYDMMRALGDTLADFALAGGMNTADDARAFLSGANIEATLAEMFAVWEFEDDERAAFGIERERGFILDHARERVEDFAADDAA